MRRREFITLVGGAAMVWPFAALAQQSDRMRRIGFLTGGADDTNSRAMYEAFRQGLQQLGWIDGRNVRIDARFGGADPVRIRKSAAELIAFSPDVILVAGSAAAALLLQETRTVPIVFTIVLDPVGFGFVATGRKRVGLHAVRIQLERQMAGAPQANGAKRDAGGHPLGPHHTCGDRPVRRDPVRGAITRGRRETN